MNLASNRKAKALLFFLVFILGLTPAFAEEEEIVVIGKRPNKNLHLLEQLSSFQIPEFSFDFEGSGGGNPVAEQCGGSASEVGQSVQEQLGQGKRVLIIGEDHFDRPDHGQIFDSLLSDTGGVCLAVEFNTLSEMNSSYPQLASFVNSAGLPVRAIDHPSSGSETFTGDNWWGFTDFGFEARDAWMSTQIREMLDSGCQTVVSFNGKYHVSGQYNNLASRLKDVAVTVNLQGPEMQEQCGAGGTFDFTVNL